MRSGPSGKETHPPFLVIVYGLWVFFGAHFCDCATISNKKTYKKGLPFATVSDSRGGWLAGWLVVHPSIHEIGERQVNCLWRVSTRRSNERQSQKWSASHSFIHSLAGNHWYHHLRKQCLWNTEFYHNCMMSAAFFELTKQLSVAVV